MNAYFLSLNPEANAAEQWDTGFLMDFLKGNVWKPSNWKDFNIVTTSSLPKDDTAIVIVPARHHAGLETKINTQLQNIDNVVLFLIGDEEADFMVEYITHPSINIWVQNPHPGRHDQYHKIGTGYPPQASLISDMTPDKTLDIYFSGQITHSRRKEMYDILLAYEAENDHVLIDRTRGFTQGATPPEYYRRMVSAKITPAPCGAVIPDSFRLFEALQSMSIPIADEKNSSGTINGYWDWLFGEDTPFPKITEWDRFFGLAPELLNEWPSNIHRITSWWMGWRREFAYKVCNQLEGKNV
jgi:hypothetical protein